VKRRISTIVAGLALAVGLVLVPSAYAAYTTAVLQVARDGNATIIAAAVDPNDDPTASVRIFVAPGTTLTTNQAPGTVLGQVEALVKALDLGGADLPLQGQLVVAGPGQVPPATQAQCLGTATPLATWVMVLTAAGQTLQVPAYLVATTGTQAALGPAYVQVCLPPPDVPAGTPGRAQFGAKLYVATLQVGGVFSSTAVGRWVAFWTPYTPGVGQINAAGTIASPTTFAAGRVTLTARRSGPRGRGALVRGRVVQGQFVRIGAPVVVFGGQRAGRLQRLGRVRTNSSGNFTFRARSGVFFRANVNVGAALAQPLCEDLAAAIAPVRCVNPSINGFTAQSRVVRKR
jgi:hypothetical protein